MKLPALLFVLCCFTIGKTDALDYLLEKMPVDLETDFALSSLPSHLRSGATVYLLDPKKGYYVSRQGTNGFSAMVIRTDWEWAEFVQDTFTAISFDAEGTKIYIPVYLDVAEMRASGKFSPDQIKETIIKKIKDGVYKAPSRVGVSYMIAPIMRSHPGTKEIVNMLMPHYMFYAPRIENSDVGGLVNSQHPFVIDTGDFLDRNNSIFNFIIIKAGEMERKQILEENSDLLKRLAAYKPYLKVTMADMHH